MPKIITDIIPPSRRRAQEESRVSQVSPEASKPGMSDMSGTPPQTPPPSLPPMGSIPSSGNRKKFPVGYVIATVVVVLASIGLLFAFGGTKVELTPQTKEVTVSASLSATPSSGDLPYETVSVELVMEKEIPAEGEETVDVPAQGTITIYNAQTKVQELIKNTRFETPDGRIFRIHDSIKIPAGTEEKPGELSVTVYADTGGTTYNIGPSTFTLPGLASSPAFKLVYAKSEQSMSGGFTGMRPSITEVVRTSGYESMKTDLETNLKTEVAGKVGETHVLLPGAVFISYTPQPDGSAPSDSVKLIQKGTATAFLFPKEALARAIAYKTLGVYTGQPVTLQGIDNLVFTSENDITPTPGMELLTFGVNGSTTLEWLIDTQDIANTLAGKSRDAAKTLLSGFGELEKARLILKPFWRNTLPSDPAKIEIEVERTTN